MINRLLIRIKTVQLVYANIQSNEPRFTSDDALFASIEASYKLYNYLLGLIVHVTDFRNEQLEAGRKKFLPTQEERFPNTRFVDNRLAEAIRSRSAVMDYCEKQELFSDFDTPLYRSIFAKIEELEAYQTYMTQRQAPDFKQDVELWKEILGSIVAQEEKLDEVLEARNIYWNDDLTTVLAAVVKAIAKIKDNDEMITIESTFRRADDEKFARDLFHHAIDEAHEYIKLIDRTASNWEVERMAMMDKVIMVCALAEVRNFVDIPVPVTINEYIELAKQYCSPKSPRFINGILDKIVKQWREDRTIIK